ELQNPLGLPSLGINLFIDLAQRIAGKLNITDCWVWGGPLMSEEWLWNSTSLSPLQILKWNHPVVSEENKRLFGWILASEVIGPECLERKE
ncbi:ENR1 protein, partial [Rostratula benghalensis]|nr:ENR1 protein [Rostratula benghalensis]